MNEIEYRFTVRPLTMEEGGGYLIEFPDLPGCLSDGETIGEAIANGAGAKRDWFAAMQEAGRLAPLPGGRSFGRIFGQVGAADAEIPASRSG